MGASCREPNGISTINRALHFGWPFSQSRSGQQRAIIGRMICQWLPSRSEVLPSVSRPPTRAAPSSVEEGKPFLRFYHSESLRKKTLMVLDAVEQDDDPTDHGAALADLVVELMESGMDYYFMKQLKLAKVGFIVEQSASISVVCALKVIAPVLRGIIGRMSGPQLISVCGSIRQLMV